MSTVVGPPEPVPTTLRGALATVPSFVRNNAVTLVVSTVAAGIFGWVVNVWMLAVKFEGNNDVPVGSPVTGQNNTDWAVVFWILFSMVLFGAVGYARAAGLRRFLLDLRTTPRVLIGLVRRDGTRARVHLLWGAGLALLLGLLVPPAVGAVVSVGLLAALPSIIGAIAGSVLSRFTSTVLRPFRPNAAPIGIEAMIVGLTGAGVALFVGFVVPHQGVRGAVAGVCILLAIVLAQQAKAGIDSATVTAALIAFAVATVWLLRRVLAAKHVLADDGGFAECGLDFGTWWRQCDGAGEVRRQARPGGVASAFGAPIGVFLGSWAGSVARLRPALFTHLAAPPPPPPDPALARTPAATADPAGEWHVRLHPWDQGQTLSIDLQDGSSIRCATGVDGAIATPWVPRGPDAAPFVDPIAHPDLFAGDVSPPAGVADGLAKRLDALAQNAPSADHGAAVQRLFHDAPGQPMPDLLDRIEQVARQHDDIWNARLETAQRDLIDLAARARDHSDALHGIAGEAPASPVEAPLSGDGQADRFAGHAPPPGPPATSLHRVGGGREGTATGDPLTVVHKLEVLQLQMHGFAEVHGSSNGHHLAVASAQTGLAPIAAPPGLAAGLPFSGGHGAGLGDVRALLPLATGPQVVHLPGGDAIVTIAELGPAPDLAGRGLAARHGVAVTDHVDRLAPLPGPGPDPAQVELQRLHDELQRYRATHGVPLAGPEPWYRAQLDQLDQRAQHTAAQRLQDELITVQNQLHTMAAMRASTAEMDRLVEMRQTLEAVVHGRLGVADGNAEAVERFGAGLAGLTGEAQLMIAARAAEEATDG